MFASGDDPGSVFDTLAGELAWNEKVNGVDVDTTHCQPQGSSLDLRVVRVDILRLRLNGVGPNVRS